MKLLAATLLAAIIPTAAAQTQWKEYEWEGAVLIPDIGQISVDLFVADHGEIEDIQVGLIIPHTWQGDLQIELWQRESDVRQTLIDRIGTGTFGYSADNFGNRMTQEKLYIDDEFPSIQGSGGIANISGKWGPGGGEAAGYNHGWLEPFVGHDKYGTWTLVVTDYAGGDTGMIRNFAVNVLNVPEPSVWMLAGLGAAAAVCLRRYG